MFNDRIKSFIHPVTDQKPVVFQLTDKWIPFINTSVLVLIFLLSFSEENFPFNLERIFSAALLSIFGYFGIRWMLRSFFNKKPDFTFGARLIIVGFYWGFSIMGGFGFLGNSIYLIFFEQIQSIDSLTMSIAAFSIALGSSHSITPKSTEENELDSA